MRAMLVVLVGLAACGGGDGPPKAWPLVREFYYKDDGVTLGDACKNQPQLAQWTSADLSKTSVRDENSQATCIVPVDDERDRFVLQAIHCRRTPDDTPASVDFTFHSGYTGGTIALEFPPGAAIADRTFGAGLVLHYDLTASTANATGACNVIGYYVDKGAPVLGPVRIETQPRRSPK